MTDEEKLNQLLVGLDLANLREDLVLPPELARAVAPLIRRMPKLCTPWLPLTDDALTYGRYAVDGLVAEVWPFRPDYPPWSLERRLREIRFWTMTDWREAQNRQRLNDPTGYHLPVGIERALKFEDERLVCEGYVLAPGRLKLQ